MHLRQLEDKQRVMLTFAGIGMSQLGDDEIGNARYVSLILTLYSVSYRWHRVQSFPM